MTPEKKCCDAIDFTRIDLRIFLDGEWNRSLYPTMDRVKVGSQV